MTKKIKTLRAVVILFAAVATPVFAQPAHGRVHHQPNFHGAYNRMNAPLYAAPRTDEQRDIENFGFSGRDPSYPGGEDPSLNPSD
jgi:hypothetical protein